MSRIKSPAPGVWRVRGHGQTPYDALRNALLRGSELTEQERKLLATLLERIDRAPAAAQKALGVTARRTRTDARNNAATEMYVRLVDRKVSKANARERVYNKYGTGVRDALDSAHELGRARGRLLIQKMNPLAPMAISNTSSRGLRRNRPRSSG